MAHEPRVQQLLDQILDSGRSPEKVCGGCPELPREVRECWRQIRRVEAELDVLLPSSVPDVDVPRPLGVACRPAGVPSRGV
jgi:hypothetical protein